MTLALALRARWGEINTRQYERFTHIPADNEYDSIEILQGLIASDTTLGALEKEAFKVRDDLTALDNKIRAYVLHPSFKVENVPPDVAKKLYSTEFEVAWATRPDDHYGRFLWQFLQSSRGMR